MPRVRHQVLGVDRVGALARPVHEADAEGLAAAIHDIDRAHAEAPERVHGDPPPRRRQAESVSSYTRRVPSTQASQRKRRSARSRPTAPNFSRRAASPSKRSRRSTKRSGTEGSQTKPLWPSATSSGMDPRSEATTGTPADIASATLKPKPSMAEGNRNTSARRKCAAFSASGT